MPGEAKIGCIGDLLVELVCSTKNGRHRRLATYSGPYPSGAAGIFIDQAAQVGGRCIFVGAVGDDAFGQVVLDRLIEHGVDVRLIKVVKGVPTGTAFVSYNDDGSRDFVYNIILSAAAQFDADATTIAALEAFGLDVMHVSGSALGDAGMAAKVLRVCKALHAEGVKISFDPNVRKELIGNPAYFASVREMIGVSSVFLPSEEDAVTLFPGRDLAELGVGIVRPRRRLCRPQERRERLRRLEPRRRAGQPSGAQGRRSGPDRRRRLLLRDLRHAGRGGRLRLSPRHGARQRRRRARGDQGRADGRQQLARDPRRLSGETRMSARDVWRSIVADNRAGEKRGIASWCTAHPQTLGAILAACRDGDDPILIEATCNQVNQHGGYTGMTPAAFRTFIEGLAREEDVDPARIILGGDHLGPNPWKGRPANEAMREARDMVRSYVEAGFSKIHLDASMACADNRGLTEATIAERAAALCAVAEEASGGRDLVYVIGTEVPIPGGETEALDSLAVTRPEAARRTYELHRSAFAEKGVAEAIGKVVALVVQPGVDMGNTQVFAYDRAKAAGLSAAALDVPGVVFEAHSTDFQTESALSNLVATHFAILKVGPALTFAFREAVVAMAAIEELVVRSGRSDVLTVLERAMDDNPVHWRGYVAADDNERVGRLFGLSDRVRYYWPDPRIAAAVETLTRNIDAAAVPPGLLSQYVGEMLLEGPGPLSRRVVEAKVGAVVARYRRATGAGRV